MPYLHMQDRQCMNSWMDVNREFWVKLNGLDLPRRAGLYVRYCYWKAANMIRPRNGIPSDFGFIYNPLSQRVDLPRS